MAPNGNIQTQTAVNDGYIITDQRGNTRVIVIERVKTLFTIPGVAAPDASATEYSKYNDVKRGQADGNYQYDEIGNLISDASEGITNIEWTVYGKISSITKKEGTKIYYSYDGSGNRISKAVSDKETVYVRDAGGNVMSIYSKDASINNGDLSQTELHLYGSSRLGIFNLKNNVAHPDLNTGRIITFTVGNKFFELSNHLGNVLATVSDKKMQHSSDNVQVDYFTADVVSAQDYYPFGMLMPGRKYSIANTSYRYGFNGKENDNEVKGEGNQQDYGMRIYDGRISRFLSIDPITKQYPELTPYQFASNRPIDGVDIDGLEYTPKGRYGPNQIAVDATAVQSYSQSPVIIQQTSAGIEFERKQQYFSTPSTHYVSPEQQGINNTRTSDAGYNLDGTKKGWLKLAENKTFRNLSDNIVSPMLTMAGTTDGSGVVLKFAKTMLRRNLAKVFYKMVGGNIRDIGGIDLAKSVSKIELNSNTKLYQWTIDGKLGDYFSVSKDSKNLGIPQMPDGTPAYFDRITNKLKPRTLVEVDISSGTKLNGLKSTAKDTKPWDGASGVNNGGDIQIYSPQIKDSNPTVKSVK